MSGLKAIRRRIVSVRNTKQITRAMKLVSAAKLRRAQDSALAGRAYTEQLTAILRRVMADVPAGFSHPLLTRSVDETTGSGTSRRRRAVVIAGERGLCGGYNGNVIKAAQTFVRNGGEIDFIAVGRRTVSAARRAGWKMVGEYEGLPEDAGAWPVLEWADRLAREFANGDFDELYVFYTKFISAMTQRVVTERVLPFVVTEEGALLSLEAEGGEVPDLQSALVSSVPSGEGSIPMPGMTGYDPSAPELLARLLPGVLAAKLAQAALESKASEHAARMSAMDSATKNADDLMARLKLFYNRARQASITKELIDIVGGSEAVK